MGPEELARFRLHRVLGRGGRTGLFGGEVWEAEDTERGGRVALKIVRVDDEQMLPMLAKMVDDACALIGLAHPNVARIRDAGDAAGTSFVVMDLVEGRTLRAIAESGGSPPDQAVVWLREAALGLSALHDAGVAHRDVKPENVVVREGGGACLVDLGMPHDDGGGVADALDDQAAWAGMGRILLGDDAPDRVRAVLDRAASADRSRRFASMRDAALALAPDRRMRVRRTLHPAVAAVALAAVIALAVLLQRLLLD